MSEPPWLAPISSSSDANCVVVVKHSDDTQCVRDDVVDLVHIQHRCCSPSTFFLWAGCVFEEMGD
jgi:hypothetical protein